MKKDDTGSDALALAFNKHCQEAKVPKAELKRWKLMADLQMAQWGFNKNKFVDKMVAGHLMDHDTARKYAVIEGFGVFHKMQGIIDEVHRRVVDDKRTLCEEELAMLTGVAKASENVTNMLESIMKISGGTKVSSKALVVTEEEPKNEPPSFYKQDIHVHVNGEKPTEKVIEIPPQENRG